MKHLSVQVGPVHDVAVDQPDLTDTGGSKVEGDGTAETAGPDNDDPSIREPFLRLLSEERDLPPITFPFPIREHLLSLILAVERQTFASADEYAVYVVSTAI
jgi:hypothetical protein